MVVIFLLEICKWEEPRREKEKEEGDSFPRLFL